MDALSEGINLFDSLENQKKEANIAEIKKREKEIEIRKHNREVMESDYKLVYFALIGLCIAAIGFLIFLIILNNIWEENGMLYYRLVFYGLLLLVIRFGIWLYKKMDVYSGGMVSLGGIVIFGSLALDPSGLLEYLGRYITIPVGLGSLLIVIGMGVLDILLVLYPIIKFLLKGPQLPEEEFPVE